MLDQSPQPLAERIADMAAELRATADEAAAQAGLVAALHALILAALVRIFTRLEDMVALWQSGQLPPLAPARHAERSAPNPPRITRRMAASRRPHFQAHAQAPEANAPESVRHAAEPAAPARPAPGRHTHANQPAMRASQRLRCKLQPTRSTKTTQFTMRFRTSN